MSANRRKVDDRAFRRPALRTALAQLEEAESLFRSGAPPMYGTLSTSTSPEIWRISD
jgi:hypothetical protein